MDKQLPSVIAVGELWLFVIGLFASVLLLGTLMIPFMSRIKIPTWLSVSGLSLDERLLKALRERFRRDGYELVADEALPEGHRLALRSDSSTYTLSMTQQEGGLCLHLSSNGVELETGEALSILSSAGPGWFVLRLERHLKELSPQATLSWRAREGSGEPMERPLNALARYSVTIAPWR